MITAAMTSRQDSYKLNYIEVEIGPPKTRYLENGEPLPLMKVAPGGGKVKYSTIVFPDKEREEEKHKEKEKGSDKKSKHDESSSSGSADRRSSNSGRGLIKGSTFALKTAAITKTLSGLTSKLTLSSSSSSSSSSHSSSSSASTPTSSSEKSSHTQTTSTATAAAVAAISALSQPPNRPPPMPELSDVSKVRQPPVGEESELRDPMGGGKSSMAGSGGRAHMKLERKESYKNAKQERPLSSSDSPRASTELRPIPAPRFYSSPSSSSHSLSSLDSNNQMTSSCGKQSPQAVTCSATPLTGSTQLPSGRGSPNHHNRALPLSPKHGSASTPSSPSYLSQSSGGQAMEKPPRTSVGACSTQDRSSTGSHAMLARNASSHPGHYSRSDNSKTREAVSDGGRKEGRAMSNGHVNKEMRNSSSISKETWPATSERTSSNHHQVQQHQHQQHHQQQQQQTKESRSSHHSPLVHTNSIGKDGGSSGGAQGGVGVVAPVTGNGGGSYSNKAASIHGNVTSRERRNAASKDQPLPSHVTQPWYYGRMLRQECEYLMLSQGKSRQYLVRDSSHRAGDLMLSVLYGSKVHHYVIQTTDDKKFQIAHHDFVSVEAILDFYHKHVIMYSPQQEPVYLGDPFIFRRR